MTVIAASPQLFVHKSGRFA